MKDVGWLFLGVLLSIIIHRIVDLLPRLLSDDFHNTAVYILLGWIIILSMRSYNNSIHQNWYYTPPTKDDTDEDVEEDEPPTNTSEKLIKGAPSD